MQGYTRLLLLLQTKYEILELGRTARSFTGSRQELLIIPIKSHMVHGFAVRMRFRMVEGSAPVEYRIYLDFYSFGEHLLR